MAQECTDNSIATSSTTPSWWDYNSSSLPSWNTSPWHTQQQNPSSNSNNSCEEDVSNISTSSFTNVSNRSSGLTVESSPRLVVQHHAPSSYEFIGEHTSDHNHNLWTNVLIQDVKENYLDMLSSRSSSAAGMFDEPAAAGACDYLKKMDNTTTTTTHTWELANSTTSLSNLDKQFNISTGFGDNNFINEGERLAINKLSSFLVSSNNCSIEPQQPCPISLSSSSIDPRYLHTDLSHMKKMFNDLTLCPIRTTRISGLINSCYDDHDMNVVDINNDQLHRDERIEPPPEALLQTPFNGVGNGCDHHLFGVNNKYYHGLMSDSSCTNGRNLGDNVMLFRSKLSKPSVDLHASSKPSLRSLNVPDCKKQRPHVTSSSSAKGTGRGQGNSHEEKKKKFEDNNNNSETVTKKPKHESSTVSSAKMQAPKMKVSERITALQQIVSPFGKTDTASVLLEAIGYIKFLQEQVQLLSNPYMKATSIKDPWGNLDRKDRGDIKVDLKSRGLCLVPISCTPQVYRENTGSDYWTPTYRGCLYR